MGSPNTEPQEYNRNRKTTYKDPGVLCLSYSYSILGVPVLGFPLQPLQP